MAQAELAVRVRADDEDAVARGGAEGRRRAARGDARDGAERALLAITFVNPRAPPPAHEGDLTVFYEATMREGYVGRVTLGDLIAAARDPDDTAYEVAFGEYGDGLGGAG